MWSKEIEDIIYDYAMEAQVLYYIYNKCITVYHRKINYFQIPSIVISSITGALLFDDRIKSNLEVSYVLASCNIFVAILTTLLKFFNYSELEGQSKILSLKYLELYEDMKLVLMKAPELRPDATQYLADIAKKRQELYTNYSIIQDKVRTEFKNRHKGIELPLKLNHISAIKIFGREREDIESASPDSSHCKLSIEV